MKGEKIGAVEYSAENTLMTKKTSKPCYHSHSHTRTHRAHKMEYYISSTPTKHNQTTRIATTEYEIIKKSRNTLTAALMIEEIMDAVIGNYMEFEQELLTTATNHALHNINTHSDDYETRSTINRRAINLLSACRQYMDQTPSWIKECTSDPKTAERFKLQTNQNYEESFSYEFLEALRNHAQHCGLAVHSFTVGAEWIEHKNGRFLEFSAQAHALRRVLNENKKFKKATLKKMPEKVELSSAFREYIGCIGSMHKIVRLEVEPHTTHARETLEAYIKRHLANNEADQSLLTALEVNSEGSITDRTLLSLEWDNVRKMLIKRNRCTLPHKSFVITNRPK